MIFVALIIYAYSKTWGKNDLEIKIHINKQLVQESAFGESPTFAIWLEDPNTYEIKTVFVTRRAAEKDWEGKAEVPVALPAWFYVDKENRNRQKLDVRDGSHKQMIVTGATPTPGYFVKRVSLTKDSDWIVWIEVNLAGDFNEYYQEFNDSLNISDEYKIGQPALIYRTKIVAHSGEKFTPEIIGMTVPDSTFTEIIRPLKGITTASNIIDEISLQVVKMKPRIIYR
jgi:hypothetical protein